MNDANRYATLLLGILIGLALGIVIGMWSPPARFEAPQGCAWNGIWCWLDEWQTLVAGLAALSGAAWTVRKIQTQIDLTRWEHAQEEIEKFAKERDRFREIRNQQTRFRFESREVFGRGIGKSAKKGVVMQTHVEETFDWVRHAEKFDFGPTVSGRKLRATLKQMRHDIGNASEKFRLGLEAVDGIDLRSSGNYSSVNSEEEVERRAEFARQIFETDGPKLWQEAHRDAARAHTSLLEAIDDRINYLRTTYGQID
ncbi:MAG: hypothetical protein ABJE00_07260 [Erythrobacter sp.]